MGHDIIKNILPALPGILIRQAALWIATTAIRALLIKSSC